MLLNVGPRADGTIPEKGRNLLLAMGDWLRLNGEAIYNTRPWLVFGEGPTRLGGGAFSEEHDRRGYCAEDHRFTRGKDGQTVYLIALAWPEQEFKVGSIKVESAGAQARVELLGHGPVEFRLTGDRQLLIQPPARRPCDHAFAFKLTGFQLGLREEALFDQPDAVHLEPGQATLEDNQVHVQVSEGRSNIGFWDRPEEHVHWLVRVSSPGRYLLRGEFCCASGSSGLKATVAGQSLSTAIPHTDGWFKPLFVSFGDLRFAEPGVYHLVLEPSYSEQWHPVNVYRLQLAPAVQAGSS